MFLSFSTHWRAADFLHVHSGRSIRKQYTKLFFYFFSSVTFTFFVFFFANFLALASIWMGNLSIYRIFHTTRIINSTSGRTVALLTTRDKFMEMTKSFRRQPDISRNSDGNCDKTRWLLKLKESGSRLEVKHSRKVNLSAIYFTCHFSARSSMPQLHKLGLMRGKKCRRNWKSFREWKHFNIDRVTIILDWAWP